MGWCALLACVDHRPCASVRCWGCSVGWRLPRPLWVGGLVLWEGSSCGASWPARGVLVPLLPGHCTCLFDQFDQNRTAVSALELITLPALTLTHDFMPNGSILGAARARRRHAVKMNGVAWRGTEALALLLYERGVMVEVHVKEQVTGKSLAGMVYCGLL